ncbi:MAG: 1-acyl-sn-glycerol-3-phosphate acyltransferase, partial [Cyanobacteria bacterium J06648_11]
FVAVTDGYACEQPTVERLAEISLILFDCVARIRGIKMPRRPQLGKRRAQLTVGKPISLGERWPQYARDRQGAKQAVKHLTRDIKVALERAIAD